MNLITVLKVAIVAIPLVVIPYTLVTRTLYGRTVVASAISGGCSMKQIQDAQASASGHAAAQERIIKSAKLIEKDGIYEHWFTNDGAFWYPHPFTDEDAYILAEDEIDFYRTVRIGNGTIVIDVGANVGTFTRRALNRGATVVAVEINPILQNCLRRTFSKEIREGRVVVYGKGAWHEDATLDLRGDTVVLEKQVPAVRLPVTTIDRMAAELNLPRVDFIKMDIEGAEKNALTGARGVISRYLPSVSIATEHMDDDQKAIPALLRTLSASRYSVKPDYCLFVSDYIARPQVIHFDKN